MPGRHCLRRGLCSKFGKEENEAVHFKKLTCNIIRKMNDDDVHVRLYTMTMT